ncbi:TolC family protein [Mariprofundus erugo]|uniref:TolC family protein n=1 Tax=Mariprofundus erugo TaxID=2528639 RepID=UPI001EE8B9D8|nr:TolC family protein [Mariprofundus erugo]
MHMIWLPLLLASCAGWQPEALDSSAGLAPSLQDLQAKIDPLSHPELPEVWRSLKVVVDDGLDENETVVLALLNSPQLKAARSQTAESAASLYAAGLLPDPQASVAVDVPKSRDPALKTGESFGLGIDLQQILTRGARRDAALESARATYLNVLWQEWQVIQQARMLWRRAIIQQQQVDMLQQQLNQTTSIWDGQHGALKEGNATLDQEGLALAPLMDAEAALLEGKRQLNTTLHDMRLLLGVEPSLSLVFTQPAGGAATLVVKPDAADSLQGSAIARLRPDLLALQAGYMSQESRVREQILAQFPSFSIGANSTRDTAGLWTLGPFINLGLPLLNGNRGNVAIARATRKRLAEEYHFQLVSTRSQWIKIVRDQQLAYEEWQALTARLPRLELTVDRMAHALGAGEIDMLTFTTLRTACFAQQARLLVLTQQLLEQQVALDTLSGHTMPDSARYLTSSLQGIHP